MPGDTNDINVEISITPNNHPRLDDLRTFFVRTYDKQPSFFVKVPGRVNLIGEHIDYCGYPVLPMAIEQNILIAIAPATDDKLYLKNINEKYKQFSCNLNSIEIKIPQVGGPEWYNYFLCGVKGIFDNIDINKPKKGMLVAVSGNIPPASGLSSSSALVSAATLATSYINEFTLNKQQLSTIAAVCERYMGTQGGGMDQAIAFLGTEGSAQFIEWNPLKATPVTLPKESIFVIANSLSEANKAATSDFNERVIECRLGCRILAKAKGLSSWRDIDRFATLQKMLDINLSELENFASKYLTKEIYSRADIVDELKINEHELETQFMTSNTQHLKSFKLRQRALHVLQESLRVYKFRIAANNDDIKEMSKLMRQSHCSLNNLYECSHNNLNKLVKISDDINVGARLTGAGWGGCIVALCDSKSLCEDYMIKLKMNYYNEMPQSKERDMNEIIFATSPQRGAEIFID